MKISILIPAHNEEKMISQCVDSCLHQTRIPDQIIVVNDGSTDSTGEILAQYGDKIQVIHTEKALGNKSVAQELGLTYVTGDVVIATDGDSILEEHFVEYVEKDFNADPELSVVAGYVKSMRHNVLTALREIDYVLGQDLYKRAQACTNFILVIPGCAGAFKTHLFHDGTINFEHDTLTEDLDFTYKLNATKHKIKFNRNVVVYTQDPPTLLSYINQMRRWYGGGWQNLKKHLGIIVNEPRAALILTPTYLEGLLFSMMLFVIPLVSTTLFFEILILAILLNVVVGAYSAIRRKRLELFLVSPFVIVLSILNAYIFMEQFAKEIVLHRRNMEWFHPERKHTVAPLTYNVPNI